MNQGEYILTRAKLDMLKNLINDDRIPHYEVEIPARELFEVLNRYSCEKR